MITVPIVFAFDNNWVMPASVCLYSLFVNARDSTIYDVYILYPKRMGLNKGYIEKVMKAYPRHKANYVEIEDNFEKAFQIRGINSLTYYRLLIADVITKYDKIVYSDADVIFQDDLSEIYSSVNLDNHYLGAVNSLANLDSDRKSYYEEILHVDSSKIFYAGNIILNSKAIRDAHLKDVFMSMVERKYRFQDLDILNITCVDKVFYLPPSFCVTTYFCDYANNKRDYIKSFWSDAEIDAALDKGIIHYNGQKPWKGYCLNFDIWWEYYRKSPVYDEKFYFDFYYNRLNEFDLLPLMKRIKILARYFVYGIRKNP